MKKQFLGILLLLAAFFNSCSPDSSSNKPNSKGSSNIITAKGKLCPDGTVEVWSYDFSEFRFKRPKFNCESGFWFCTINGGWHFDGCMDQFGNVYPANPTLTDEGGKLVAFPHKTESIVTILFPYGLVNKPGNSIEDFKVFNVDEEISIGDMKLKKGEYPTKFVSDVIAIDVPFY